MKTHQLPYGKKNRKKALVLPGGGARGAYQVGTAKALLEQGIEFDFICGTSIGGLNSVFIAQGDIARLEDLWSHGNARDVFRLPGAAEFGRMILGNKLALLDNSPLEKMLRSLVDLQKLKQSRMKAGVVSTELCTLTTNVFTTDDFATTEDVIDAMMATAAIPVLFPPRQIRGDGLWVDGGLAKNTPLQAAIDLGATEIFMVVLNPANRVRPTTVFEVLARCQDIAQDASVKKEIQIVNLLNWLSDEGLTPGHQRVKVEIFQPSKPMRSLLEISPEWSRQLIQEGYDDAMEQLACNFRRKQAAEV